MESPRIVLFLCPHNAATSLLAAAEFNRLAASRGLPFQAGSAGADPAAAPSPDVVAALRNEGIDVASHRPRRVTAADLIDAHRTISLGCDLADLPHSNAWIESWDDVPPPSHDLGASRAAIQRHVSALVDELAAQQHPATRL